MKNMSERYKASGVDITAGYQAVELLKNHVTRTRIPGVLSDIGGFGGLFLPDLSEMREPVLVSGTDGVGTKLKLAFQMDRHDTIGIDCVAMCVNDIICCGARPLFFLDYIAVGKNIPERVASIVSGVAEGCVQAGCALIGGETAEMPGFYAEGEYDIAGFSVGIADKRALLDGSAVREGDVLVALPSSGLHSNGYSLARKLFDTEHADLNAPCGALGASLGEALLAPTKIYVKPILELLKEIPVHGIAHITGGGFFENIPRALPDGMTAVVDRKSLRIPPIFTHMRKVGNLDELEMFHTFNMGVGMCVVLSEKDAERAMEFLRARGEDAYFMGRVELGGGGLRLC